MIISALAGSRIVGVVSAIMGFSSMIIALLDLGASIGVQRFYGMAIGRGDRGALSTYFWTLFTYLSIVYGLASLTTVSLAFTRASVGGIEDSMLLFASIYIALYISQVANSLATSMLKTDVLFVASVLGNVLRFAAGLYIVYIGWGWIGAASAYFVYSLQQL